MTLYEILSDIASYNGFFIHVDLDKKSIKYKKQYIVKDGALVADEIITECKVYAINKDQIVTTCNPEVEVQALYDKYVCSKPSTSNKKSYFIPKKSDELTFEELINGMDREEARCKLETFIVCCALTGTWQWKQESHWFWKGKRGLIIYRKWVCLQEGH